MAPPELLEWFRLAPPNCSLAFAAANGKLVCWYGGLWWKLAPAVLLVVVVTLGGVLQCVGGGCSWSCVAWLVAFVGRPLWLFLTVVVVVVDWKLGGQLAAVVVVASNSTGRRLLLLANKLDADCDSRGISVWLPWLEANNLAGLYAGRPVLSGGPSEGWRFAAVIRPRSLTNSGRVPLPSVTRMPDVVERTCWRSRSHR